MYWDYVSRVLEEADKKVLRATSRASIRDSVPYYEKVVIHIHLAIASYLEGSRTVTVGMSSLGFPGPFQFDAFEAFLI